MGHLFEQIAAAVIMLGELIFAVRRQSTFAVRFQIYKYIDNIIKKKIFQPRLSETVTLSSVHITLVLLFPLLSI